MASHDSSPGPYVTNEFESVEETMPPPPLGGEYESLPELLLGVNKFANHHGYAVVIGSTGKNKKGIKDNAQIV